MDMSEIEKLERAKVGAIKLSEAIRIGCTMHPQGFGHYLFNGRTCAIGAAREAMGKQGWNNYIMVMGYSDLFFQLHDEVVRRNDSQHQTREAIADWLEGQGY